MERMRLVVPEMRELLEARQVEDVKDIIAGFEPVEVAEVFEHFNEVEQLSLLKDLDPPTAAKIFEELHIDEQMRLISGLEHRRAAGVLNEMSPDDRADLFEDLPEELGSRFLALMKQPEAADVRELMQYPSNTAGGLMTTKYASALEETTVGEAMKNLRERARKLEVIYYLYVEDRAGRLVGVVSLKQLVLSAPERRLSDIMKSNPVYLKLEMHQEEAAKEVAKYDFVAMPVVDELGRLRGIVTVDDVVDVIETEATEDMHKMASMQVVDEAYLRVGFLSLARKRIVWLVALLFIETLSGKVLQVYSGAIEAVVALAYFIPLLTGTGGNAGAQTSTMIVRGLATGEISIRDGTRVISREILMGLFLGLILGTFAFARAYWGEGNLALGLTLGTSVIAVVTMATLAGSLLPIFFRLLRRDPAVMAGPFITTLVDVVSLIIYLEIARRLLF
ncbi:MAG: magnesium transporter [Candidatus Eiseniibacteriota bacterium]|nr:MAG: magnesium transporter [Candidatus Eisenbacteria bacterium]